MSYQILPWAYFLCSLKRTWLHSLLSPWSCCLQSSPAGRFSDKLWFEPVLNFFQVICHLGKAVVIRTAERTVNAGCAPVLELCEEGQHGIQMFTQISLLYLGVGADCNAFFHWGEVGVIETSLLQNCSTVRRVMKSIQCSSTQCKIQRYWGKREEKMEAEYHKLLRNICEEN